MLSEDDFRALESRLNLVINVTEDDLFQFATECQLREPHRPWKDWSIYYKAGDLANYMQARDWWPHDAPHIHKLPALNLMIRWRADIGVRSFGDHLNYVGNRCGQWLANEGRNVQFPNETKAQTKARKNREAQARFRARASAKETPAGMHAAQGKALYAEYLRLCAERKAVMVELDVGIKAALAVWEAHKNSAP